MKLLSWLPARRDTAARWFARLQCSEVSSQLDSHFRKWLARKPENERQYERHELTWELAGELAQDPEIEALVRQAEQSSQASAAGAPTALFPAALGWGVAAAGSMVVASIAWLWLGNSDPRQLYVTGIGEQRTVVLPDKSQVTLNTRTRLRVSYTPSLRTIELDAGEATFTVTHEPSRPFEVHAAGGVARALGTRFNVFEFQSGVTVAVLEGRVEVAAARTGLQGKAAAKSAVVTAGQEVDYSAQLLQPVHVSELDRINAWHAKQIVFNDIDLDAALADFNRYCDVPLVLGDRSLATRRVTGVFRIRETEAFLNALRDAFGIRAVHGANSIVLWPTQRTVAGLTTAQSNGPDARGR